ncbi:MAG: hypothetical protein RIC51_06895 [Erythrobacter sp.]|uniref:hypothetical protein n=1 Tax=Erythrobacter sp. TaxID=1042 RepID=UPI0032EC4400
MNVRHFLFCTFACVALPIAPLNAGGNVSDKPERKSETFVRAARPGEYQTKINKKFDAGPGKEVPGLQGSPSDKALKGAKVLCDLPFGPLNGDDELIGSRPQPEAGAALIGAVATSLFKFAFKKEAKAIEKELARYKSEYSASISIPAFERSEEGDLRPVPRCLRIVRASRPKGTGEANDVEVEFDAILFVHWVPEAMAWQLVPIAIATGRPVAKGSSVGFAMSFAGTSPYVEDGIGKQATLNETVIAKGKYALSSDAEYPDKMKWAAPVKYCDMLERLPVVETEEAGTDKDQAATGASSEKTIADYLLDCSITSPTARTGIVPGAALLPIPGQVPQAGRVSSASLAFKIVETGKGRRKAKLEDWKLFAETAGGDIGGALGAAIGELLKGDDE